MESSLVIALWQFQIVTKPRLHYFDLLWICCKLYIREIVDIVTCQDVNARLAVRLVVRQIRNRSNVSGVWALFKLALLFSVNLQTG